MTTYRDRSSRSPVIFEVTQDQNIFRLEEERKLRAYRKQQDIEAELYQEDQRILYHPTQADMEDVFWHVRRESAFRRLLESRATEERTNPQEGLHGPPRKRYTDAEYARSIISQNT